MSSQDDKVRPSCPSILSYIPPRAKKVKSSEEVNEYSKTYADKETQVTSNQIADAMIYHRSIFDRDLVKANVSGLPEITYDHKEPKDFRVKEFARLVAYEMERVQPEKRSRLFSNIIDLIRRVSEEHDIDDVSLPSFEDSE
jgi:hypothetical protein